MRSDLYRMEPDERERMAKQLRGNLILAEILQKAATEILSQWKTADTVEERERLHAENKALERFSELLESAIRDVPAAG